MGLKIGDDGLSYVVPGAPFEFMYSYTETPKVKPVALREPPVVPFGLTRPWTGRKPFPPSKKKLPEFDSFVPPPANKKGVKPVQNPGPFLPGSGPKYAVSREEVLGEPLTDQEVKELVETYKKTDRQLNMGRDGLTHNMLDNIHAHWKRRRVCKIKCKGVCTVDMDNVCQQLEEKTGGKIIYRKGGVVYLFRGRNYNYKTRPRFPLMLWKPAAPVYPRLVPRVPEGLTLNEATDMRKRGRELTPICKLAKNGVYINLVKNVKEAFEACELVRINSQGLNPSDYRKIGAKLKDLVPCVLVSFENEHILMWRGHDWKPSILLPEDGGNGTKSSETDSPELVSSDDAHSSTSNNDEETVSNSSNIPIQGTNVEISNVSTVLTESLGDGVWESEGTSLEKDDGLFEVNDAGTSDNSSDDDIQSTANTCEVETRMIGNFPDEEEPPSVATQSDSILGSDSANDLHDSVQDASADSEAHSALQDIKETLPESSPSPCTEHALGLLREAVESGSAVVLDDSSLDADVVYQKSVALAQIAPPGLVFRYCRPQKVAVQESGKQETGCLEVDEAKGMAVAVSEPVPEKKPKDKKSRERKKSRTPKAEDFRHDYLNFVPQGSLKVDELAKLLA